MSLSRSSSALLAAASAVALVFTPGCGAEDGRAPYISDDNGFVPSGVFEGACPNEGHVRSCHVTVGEHDGIVDCWLGQQVCTGGVWSECAGNVKLKSHAVEAVEPTPVGATTKTQSYTNSSASKNNPACANDPCNPDCVSYTEDPPDITPPYTSGSSFIGTGNEWGNGPSGFVGKQDCGTATNSCLTGYPKACNGNPVHQNKFDGCQSDHSCNAAGDCERNAAGYTWPTSVCSTTAGPDLTIGAACATIGKNTFPLCNRGNTKVAAGTSIPIKFKDGDWLSFDSCSPSGGSASCNIVLAGDLKPGECVQIVDSGPAAAGQYVCTAWGNGNEVAFVNWGGVVPECGLPMPSPATSATKPGCSNNWSDVKKGNNGCQTFTTGGYSTQKLSTTYTAQCPAGQTPVWGRLAWDASIACSPGSCSSSNQSSIKFELQTANAATPTDFSPATPVLIATATKSTEFCPMSGVPGCPIDVYAKIGGVAAKREIAKLTVTMNPSPDGQAAPILKSWELSFTCKWAQ